ncbi:hypothetical protein BMG05_22310 [Mycobacterium malmoense]|nr:hypothetical protein BMG05_22310 [Mycobacterium malmoense]
MVLTALTSWSQLDVSRTHILSEGAAAMSSTQQDTIDLQTGTGRMSDDLRSLNPITTIQLDVITEGQLALHMLVPISVPSTHRALQTDAVLVGE